MMVRTYCEDWPLRKPFVISRESIESVSVLVVEIEDNGVVGRAETIGVDYRGETPQSIALTIHSYMRSKATLPSRNDLMDDLPAGGARNGLDCALWDYESRLAKQPVWKMAGLPEPKTLRTTFTISLDKPELMAEAVGEAPVGAVLKLKIGGGDGHDVARVEAVRAVAPNAEIIVDANEAWTRSELEYAVPRLFELGVDLVEQPLRAGADEYLDNYQSPIPLCADESFDDCKSYGDIVGRYSFVNVKLDKCGGLTEALAAVGMARATGFRLFSGCMLGTSLGMAPAFLVGQLCEYVDLDGPLLLSKDRKDGFHFNGAQMEPCSSDLWGWLR